MLNDPIICDLLLEIVEDEENLNIIQCLIDGISTDEEWEDAQQLYDWLRMDMEDRLAELDEMLENLFASIQ